MKRPYKETQMATVALLPKIFRKAPILFWSSITLSIMIASLALAQYSPDPRAFLGFCISYAIGFTAIPLVFRASFHEFSDLAAHCDSFMTLDTEEASKTSASDWMKREMKFFSGNAPMLAFGVLTGAIALLSFQLGNYPAKFDHALGIFAASVQFFSATLAGIGIYVAFSGCLLVWRLGAFKVIVRSHRYGIKSVGTLLSKCYFWIALAWSAYVCSAVFSISDSSQGLAAAKYPFLILVAPTLTIFLVMFFVCQYPLHLRMTEYKRENLLKLDLIIDKLSPTHTENFSKDAREAVEFLEKRRNEFASLPEWPFGYKGAIGALGSTVTVILPATVSTLMPVVTRAAGLVVR